MKLIDLLSGIEHSSMSDLLKLDLDIKRLIAHSQEAQKGDLFVAMKGDNFDGHDFLNYVASRGVNVVIVEEPTMARDDLVQVKVKNSRRALSILARNFYKDPSKNINLIGITGTNGKTTVSYLLENIFKEAKVKNGRIGTINYRIGEEVIDARHTTPDALVLNRLLWKMVEQSIPYCVMEASSHGLDQGRVEDIRFKAAIFTNLSHEHLDYHKTLDSYLDAKLKLFRNLDAGSYAVINKDSEYFDDIISRIDTDPVTYGIDSSSDVTAKDLRMNLDGSAFRIFTPQGSLGIKTPLIGKHNIYNILAAASVAAKEGIDPQAIKGGVEKLKTVPGRMEAMRCGQAFDVFVDYAHTEDALRNVLEALRKLQPHNKIILVFGCGGDRDRAKRPKMGRVASELADFTIVTSDNPRSEEPKEIAKEIEKGFKGRSAKYTVILDRFKAIKKALTAAEEGVTVLIAGKGHEKKQIFKNKSIPFDDREVTRSILKTL